MSVTKKTAKATGPVPCWQAKACPFCGWVPSIWKIGRYVLLGCNYQRCGVSPSVEAKTCATVLRRWNKRSPIPAKVKP